MYKRQTQFHELETPEDLEAPIQVMDLPYVQIAPATVILATLLLLKPSSDVNFKKSDEHTVKSVAAICREKNLPEVFLEQMVDWYSRMSLEGLDSAVKICAKIPALASTADGKELLAYYTTILSKYNKLQDNDDVVDWLLKEVSLRISEKCGRTAQPAMNRTFEVSGLATSIELHEPALTSDNLGLKTWGASLVLARKICQKLSTFEPSENLRILELGAGTGLVGIAFIQKILEVGSTQKFRVHLTDLPDIVPNLQKNVDLNKCNREPNVEVAVDVLDWTDPSSFQEKYGYKKFDVLLIADPIYSPQHPRWVVNMIKEFLHPHGVAPVSYTHLDVYKRQR